MVAIHWQLRVSLYSKPGMETETLGPNSEFLKAVISEHGRFFIMFLKRDESSN
jgi:hypothetical protein